MRDPDTNLNKRKLSRNNNIRHYYPCEEYKIAWNKFSFVFHVLRHDYGRSPRFVPYKK